MKDYICSSSATPPNQAYIGKAMHYNTKFTDMATDRIKHFCSKHEVKEELDRKRENKMYNEEPFSK